jgi:hypothetical protein
MDCETAFKASLFIQQPINLFILVQVPDTVSLHFVFCTIIIRTQMPQREALVFHIGCRYLTSLKVTHHAI